MMFCPNCGSPVREGSRFCFGCGHQLQAGADPAPDAPQAPRAAWNIRSAGNSDVVAGMAERLHRLASTEKLEGFSLKEMFSEAFKKRTPQEIDDYFSVGTSCTTPAIADVETGWPKPWLFVRVFALVLLVYIGFSLAMDKFMNLKLLPGLIIMGCFATPLATLILFYEWNTPRNVPFHRVLSLVLMGGVASIGISLLGFEFADLSWLGASSAGIIEEVGKMAAVILLFNGTRYPFILNGLLAGAAVGAGFSAFESAGYAFKKLWDTKVLELMTDSIHARAFHAPFGHLMYTSIAAGALWRAKGLGPLQFKHVLDPTFLRAFALSIACHMFWNSPIPNILRIKDIILVFGYVVVLGLVQQGLKQVKNEQVKALEVQVAKTASHAAM
jgi:RsiW-degrading membrane proteinase PrsW (M82 family)